MGLWVLCIVGACTYLPLRAGPLLGLKLRGVGPWGACYRGHLLTLEPDPVHTGDEQHWSGELPRKIAAGQELESLSSVALRCARATILAESGRGASRIQKKISLSPLTYLGTQFNYLGHRCHMVPVTELGLWALAKTVDGKRINRQVRAPRSVVLRAWRALGFGSSCQGRVEAKYGSSTTRGLVIGTSQHLR